MSSGKRKPRGEKKKAPSPSEGAANGTPHDESLAKVISNFESLLDAVSDWITVVDSDGRILYTNRACETFVGLSQEETLGRSCCEVLHDSEAMLPRCPLSRMAQTGERETEDLLDLGGRRWLQITVHPLEGGFDGAVHIVRDITECKRVEEQRLEGEAFLGNLLDMIPIPVFYKDREERYLGFNRAFEEFFGKTRKDLIGKTAFDISPIDLAEAYHAKDIELFEAGGVQQYECQVEDARGKRRDVIFDKAVFEDGKGVVAGLVGTILDITERRKMEDLIREQLVFLDAIMDQSPFAMWVADGEGIVQKTNRALRQSLGVFDDQVSERYCVFDDRNLLEQGLMPEVRAVFEEFRPARFIMSWRGERADTGDLASAPDIWIDVSMFPILGADGSLASVVCQWVDITNRKRAEDALRESEQRYSELFDHAPVGYHEIDREGRIVQVNQTELDMLGFSAEEMVGRPVWEFAMEREAARIAVLEKTCHGQASRQVLRTNLPATGWSWTAGVGGRTALA